MNVINKPLEVERLIGEGTVQALVTTETMVSGAGREAIIPLIADASLVIGQAETQQGRVVLDGKVYCQAMYRQGGEASVRALGATANMSQVIDMDGVQPGMILRVTGQVEHVDTVYENGHMVFRVSLGLHAQVSELQQIQLIEDITRGDDLEKKFAELKSCKLSAESSAEAVLREELSLPAELDARMALMESSTVRINSTQPDLGGVRVKGEVMTETLIGTGVTGRPVAKVSVALPFDQLVELPEWLTGNVQSDAQVMGMDTRVSGSADGGDGILSIECRLKVHIDAIGQDQQRALVDVYSTSGNGIEVESAPVELSSGTVHQDTTEQFKGTMLLPEGAPGAGTVLCVRARPMLGDWRAQNGRTEITGIITAQVLYLENNGTTANVIQEDIPFSVQTPGELPEDAWIMLSASGAEAGALMSDRLEIRCQIKISGSYRRQISQNVAESVVESGALPAKEGILIIWPRSGDDLWSLGKRYGIGAGEITKRNAVKDPLSPGKALVVTM